MGGFFGRDASGGVINPNCMCDLAWKFEDIA